MYKFFFIIVIISLLKCKICLKEGVEKKSNTQRSWKVFLSSYSRPKEYLNYLLMFM
jgi:hypothetical protein